MTYLCAAIHVDAPEDVPLALERVARAKAAGARMVEWRLDALAEVEEGLEAIEELLAGSPLPSIATIRAEEEGGTWAGEERDRIALLEAIGTGSNPPRYIDLELGAWQRSANLRQKVRLAIEHDAQARDVSTKLVLSTHEFSGRPQDLLGRVAEMAASDACAVAKIVWRGRSLRDNLEVFELLRERTKPTIALCMGEFGLMSRVLAPKFGGFLTFAAIEEGGGTAPGQPTVEELRSVYRFDAIDRETRVYGVVGWPVSHSRGPVIHNAGFGAIGFNGVYLPMPVGPEWVDFKATMISMIEDPALDFRGCSVTLPHKAHLLRLVEELGGEVDPDAARIGAANTLVVGDDGSLRCLNTDAPAAVDALVGGMGIAHEDLAGKRIAVLGAGGVARAVSVGLADAGAKVVVVNRTRENADRMVDDLDGGDGRITSGDVSELACGCFHAFVNCTPVGMVGGPAPDESPLPDDVALDDGVTVFDTVYTPARTPLIAEAEARGSRVVSGTEMFLGQARRQFEAWTGQPVPDGAFEDRLS
ncbi:MAG: type I 3-dehydroquinate dehydratase [Phycisphaerales bacterium]|nr:type I 3-dehydroquinate dehydratase [Phycisphaerales bacterium]